ncbi:hypothetical protein M0Q97_13680 [Candidatus Dojkabacteria bacterium]|jgi:hypothetical protein|nr:hypothetical protein [Candidatus Dojkabacteria bacterium]
MKVKIFHEDIYKIENIMNNWFQINNDIDIKNIKSYHGHTNFYTCVMVYYEDKQYYYDKQYYENIFQNKEIIKQMCYYESDGTTAMNCKYCGRPKYVHNQGNFKYDEE